MITYIYMSIKPAALVLAVSKYFDCMPHSHCKVFIDAYQETEIKDLNYDQSKQIASNLRRRE